MRRKTVEVQVGNLPMGGDNPVRVQSMTTVPTTDTEGCIAQIKRIVDAGGEYVRLTTQGIREAENLKNIKEGLRREGYDVPIIADVHFNANVADVAALYADKVRINPGNYVDPARKFKQLDYTDEEYADEIKKIEERFVPFLNICKEHHTAIRIGVNHGSLSDRIMSRYGDTPEGMVESCMEFLRICVKENFMNVVISIKASNTEIMVRTVRLLVATMDSEDMHFPIHLGVIPVAYGILQAARVRITKTEYISCPGCGRTLYNLEETIAKIKAATSHLSGLKIAIMGCIVNGPGEMADADYGYVGAARGKVSLYKRKQCIEMNIPEEKAVDRLLQFIEEDQRGK